MNVLWITNIVFPDAYSKLFGTEINTASGGWLTSLADGIKAKVELAVAAPSNRVSKLTKVELDGYVFYILPIGKGNIKYNKSYEPIWREIKNEFRPDLVHLHGTEYSHGLAYINACGAENVIVSIQGVMSEIAKHYLDGLSNKDIFCNLTLRDIFKKTLWGEKKKALERAKSEPLILQQVKYVIGRTEFDHAHAMAMNPDVRYFHCDEVLRNEFYSGLWSYEKCEPHTIFVSSSSYPLKGFHMLLKAFPIIKQQYPDVRVRVAGGKRSSKDILRNLLSLTGYQKFLSELINSLQLESCVEFLGILSAEDMKKELLRANVFLSTSSNENSSNAIGEAQLLGVPCLASYVGGTPDMIPNGSCGELYNYFDTKVLAYKVCKLFENSSSFDNSNMIDHATKRHDKDVIMNTLLNIYGQIIEDVDEISKK